MKTNKHIIQLDGLRFFAVLAVMIAHWLQWQWTTPVLSKLPFTHGVTLFFVLSGFLITSILFRNRDKYDEAKRSKGRLIKNFYIRRFLRIFPIYYLLLFGLFIFDYQNTRELFPWLISYTSNIYQSMHNEWVGEFNHFWSLAVEEQFYLFWPFVVLFVKPKRSIWVIVITILLAIATRLYLFSYTGKWMATSFFTLSCMHSLGLGALVAYLKLYRQEIAEKLSNNWWVYGSVILYGSAFIWHKSFDVKWMSKVFDDLLFSIMAAFIILKASSNGFKGLAKILLENKFVTYSGKVSYGLYVYHLFIPTLYYYLAPKMGIIIYNKYGVFVMMYLLTLLIASASWYLMEKPINDLKRKVPYFK